MADILLADIGGTTSRFALAQAGGRPERVITIRNDDVTDIESLIVQALDQLGAKPFAAVLAIAGPVDGDALKLTNRPWQFRLSALSDRFGFRFCAINDFEALASALPLLADDDTRQLGAVARKRDGVKAVVGPGTGLGVAALIPRDAEWQVVASEGGHVAFGPAAPDEGAIFAAIAQEIGYVSAESVLSGPGLARLHRAVNPGVMKLSPEMILTQARAGHPEARRSIAMFTRLLGRFAGDVALTFKATGGVYIAGGVAAGLGPLLDARLFRAAFEAHPPHQKLLADVPASLITCAEPGLLGCAAIAGRIS